jgi:hypothetical protein
VVVREFTRLPVARTLLVGLISICLAAATGCGGADSPTTTPVDRSELLAAFAAVDEPVRLMTDERKLTNPFDVGLDSVFVPASWGDVPDPPFIVDLFDDAASARATSTQANEAVAGDNPEIIVRKNVSLEVSRLVARKHRDRLVSALKSL